MVFSLDIFSFFSSFSCDFWPWTSQVSDLSLLSSLGSPGVSNPMFYPSCIWQMMYLMGYLKREVLHCNPFVFPCSQKQQQPQVFASPCSAAGVNSHSQFAFGTPERAA